MAFPSLSKKPSFPIEKKPLDTDLKSSYEAGYQVARPRFTRDLFDYTLTYPLLLEADMLLLEAHIASVKSTVIFSWVHPERGTTHNVRYQERPTLKLVGKLGDGVTPYWSTEFTLREA